MDKYPFAFGFLESAVHRALGELSGSKEGAWNARNILIGALRYIEYRGIELHWPDDVKKAESDRCEHGTPLPGYCQQCQDETLEEH